MGFISGMFAVQEVIVMSILDITEEKIFQTLGRGKDPRYKPIDRASLKKTVKPFDFTRLLE